MARCKITVLKRAFFQDIVDEYVGFENYQPCECMTEGQVYYTGGEAGNEKPEGFCDEAWKAIYQYVDSGKMPNVDSDTVRIALGFICAQIDEDCEKYKACQREGRRKAQGK